MLIADPGKRFHLYDIVPKPLAGSIGDSEIWAGELQFEPGLRYAILAPSGRGKSTLAHILYGLRRDFEGRLDYGSYPLGQDANKLLQWRREDWAIVFQDLRLFPELSGHENLKLHREMSHAPLPTEAMTQRAKLMGIDQLLDQAVEQLSFGQMQRVAILRAISRPFHGLILDEPFSHLDEENESIATSVLEEERQRYGAGLIIFCLNEPPAGMEVDKVLKL